MKDNPFEELTFFQYVKLLYENIDKIQNSPFKMPELAFKELEEMYNLFIKQDSKCVHDFLNQVIDKQKEQGNSYMAQNFQSIKNNFEVMLKYSNNKDNLLIQVSALVNQNTQAQEIAKAEKAEKLSKQNILNAQKPRQRSNDTKDIIYTFCKDNRRNPSFLYKGKLNASAIHRALPDYAQSLPQIDNVIDSFSIKMVEEVVRKFKSRKK